MTHPYQLELDFTSVYRSHLAAEGAAIREAACLGVLYPALFEDMKPGNCSLNLLKALEVTLYNGVDAVTGKPLGLSTGPFASFRDFDALLHAYQQQVEYYLGYLAQRHAREYQVEREAAAFLFISMLFEGCIASGRSVVEHGGTHYLGGVIETFGMVNVADSLAAIKKLVYEEKRISPETLLAVLDANFAGYEPLRQALKVAPKFGNDDPAADGRRAFEPLANGNTPTAGNDRKGVTALLNSLSKIKADQHAGYVQNLKFNPQWFRSNRPVLEALLDTYFANGGTQAMITVVSRGDLEAAMHAPEKYSNLIVRVGGFSARFVELSREVQLDLIQRTLY